MKIDLFRKINFIFTMIGNAFSCRGDYGDVDKMLLLTV